MLDAFETYFITFWFHPFLPRDNLCPRGIKYSSLCFYVFNTHMCYQNTTKYYLETNNIDCMSNKKKYYFVCVVTSLQRAPVVFFWYSFLIDSPPHWIALPPVSMRYDFAGNTFCPFFCYVLSFPYGFTAITYFRYYIMLCYVCFNCLEVYGVSLYLIIESS